MLDQATCEEPAQHALDDGAERAVLPPSVYNAGAYSVWGWDGAAHNLEDFLRSHALDPGVLGMTKPKQFGVTLSSIPDYARRFRDAFPAERDPVGLDEAAKAIGTFIRGLVTPSRFDRFLRGERGALDEEEKFGLMNFGKLGCVDCHNGAGLGGDRIEKVGRRHSYAGSGGAGPAQQRTEISALLFRVPGLRNVQKTGPYLHDGAAADLPNAVSIMLWLQMSMFGSEADVSALTAFLESLTGEIPADYIAKPSLPSGADGSKPVAR